MINFSDANWITAIATVVSTITAVATVMFTYIMYASEKRGQRPLCYIELNSFANGNKSYIQLYMMNKGGGPLIVKQVEVKEGDNKEWMSFIPSILYRKWKKDQLLTGTMGYIYWDLPKEGRTISVNPEDKWVLLEFSGCTEPQLHKLEREFYNKIPKLRVTYMDIFDTLMPPYSFDIQNTMTWMASDTRD